MPVPAYSYRSYDNPNAMGIPQSQRPTGWLDQYLGSNPQQPQQMGFGGTNIVNRNEYLQMRENNALINPQQGRYPSYQSAPASQSPPNQYQNAPRSEFNQGSGAELNRHTQKSLSKAQATHQATIASRPNAPRQLPNLDTSGQMTNLSPEQIVNPRPNVQEPWNQRSYNSPGLSPEQLQGSQITTNTPGATFDPSYRNQLRQNFLNSPLYGQNLLPADSHQ